MRKILLASFFCLHLFASNPFPATSTQLILVIADDFNSTTALLQAYEKNNHVWSKHGNPVPVNLGRKGLGWGLGLASFQQNPSEPLKHEGDGRAPAGLFRLSGFFAYEKHPFSFEYLPLGAKDICVDDVTSPDYNQLLKTAEPERYLSYETMRRKDDLYKLGIVVEHNPNNIPAKGSCIFLHIQKAKGKPTAGCTSLDENVLFNLMMWLDPHREPLLLQLPRTAYERHLTFLPSLP